MIQTTTSRRATVATVVRVLLVFGSVTFLVAALLHMGARIPLGFALLAEPRIVPATIVEGLAGVVLAVSAYAVFSRKTWAWPAALAAQAFALAGVLLGMWALAANRGPRTELNDVYHRVMLLVLLAGLVLLLTPMGRAALGRGDRA
ncbi:MAG TPA: hypothetical protein VEQ11_06295 [Chloroflexota bacterium]|nr:hypothetical protein [Chloroflexota bacterium]